MANLFNTGSNYNLSYSYYVPFGYKLPILKAENCGVCDLGSLTWTKNTTYTKVRFLANAPSDSYTPASNDTIASIYLNGYTTYSTNTLISNSDNGIALSSAKTISFADTQYAEMDATTFKSAMSGVYLYYQRTTDTSWTAPTTYTIYDDNPLYKVGTYTDNINSNGVRTNNIGIKVLDGTEDWTYDSQSKRYYTQIPLAKLPSTPRTMPALCTHFRMLSNGESSFVSGDGYIGTGSGSVATVFLHTTEITSLSDWQTWLATNTPILYYVLDSATTETITAPSINTVKGDNYLECITDVSPSSISGTYRLRNK